MSFNFFPWLIFPFLEKNFEYKELTDDQQSSCDTVIQHVEGIELYTNANSSSPSKRSKTSSKFKGENLFVSFSTITKQFAEGNMSC